MPTLDIMRLETFAEEANDELDNGGQLDDTDECEEEEN